EDAVVITDAQLYKEDQPLPLVFERPADRLNNSFVLSFLIGMAGLTFLLYYFVVRRGALDFNSLIFIFLTLSIMLHGRPSYFLHYVNEAMKGAAGIAIQFPFYAGLMGMIVGSGLGATLSNMFVS